MTEASTTSGARMQARPAYEHAKRVFLLDTPVAEQTCAQHMVVGPARALQLRRSRDSAAAATL